MTDHTKLTCDHNGKIHRGGEVVGFIEDSTLGARMAASTNACDGMTIHFLDNATRLGEHIGNITAQRDALAYAVQEWVCEKCMTAYPGPPQKGFACVQCPKCGGSTMPRPTYDVKQARATVALFAKNLEDMRNQRNERTNQRDALLAALEGLHKVCQIALAGEDGRQHTYFETRAGHFVEATKAMVAAEKAIAGARGPWCCEKGQSHGKQVCDECAATNDFHHEHSLGIGPDERARRVSGA